jgi:flavin-dependent dehydrogenase
MDPRDTPVAIVGAGPAGSALARALALAGVGVTLFHDPAGRKHCGGGVPPRAFTRVPWLRTVTAPHTEIARISLSSPGSGACDVDLPAPLAIYDRAAFDASLREAAARAGSRIVSARVTGLRRERGSWSILAGGREHRAGVLAGADGASSRVRRLLSSPFPARSLSLCAGYYVAPPAPGTASIGFIGPRASYAWLFPGPGRSSAGIVAPLPGCRGESLLRILRDWLEMKFPGFRFDYSRPYAALVPTAGFHAGRVHGDGWALIGDAAGVADPVTREGICFAVHSAELLASALRKGRPGMFPVLLKANLLK